MFRVKSVQRSQAGASLLDVAGAVDVYTLGVDVVSIEQRSWLPVLVAVAGSVTTQHPVAPPADTTCGILLSSRCVVLVHMISELCEGRCSVSEVLSSASSLRAVWTECCQLRPHQMYIAMFLSLFRCASRLSMCTLLLHKSACVRSHDVSDCLAMVSACLDGFVGLLNSASKQLGQRVQHAIITSPAGAAAIPWLVCSPLESVRVAITVLLQTAFGVGASSTEKPADPSSSDTDEDEDNASIEALSTWASIDSRLFCSEVRCGVHSVISGLTSVVDGLDAFPTSDAPFGPFVACLHQCLEGAALMAKVESASLLFGPVEKLRKLNNAAEDDRFELMSSVEGQLAVYFGAKVGHVSTGILLQEWADIVPYLEPSANVSPPASLTAALPAFRALIVKLVSCIAASGSPHSVGFDGLVCVVLALITDQACVDFHWKAEFAPVLTTFLRNLMDMHACLIPLRGNVVNALKAVWKSVKSIEFPSGLSRDVSMVLDRQRIETVVPLSPTKPKVLSALPQRRQKLVPGAIVEVPAKNAYSGAKTSAAGSLYKSSALKDAMQAFAGAAQPVAPTAITVAPSDPLKKAPRLVHSPSALKAREAAMSVFEDALRDVHKTPRARPQRPGPSSDSGGCRVSCLARIVVRTPSGRPWSVCWWLRIGRGNSRNRCAKASQTAASRCVRDGPAAVPGNRSVTRLPLPLLHGHPCAAV
jgi:hypothetical protein